MDLPPIYRPTIIREALRNEVVAHQACICSFIPSCLTGLKRNSGAGGITADAGQKLALRSASGPAEARSIVRRAPSHLELSTNIKRRDAHRFYLREASALKVIFVSCRKLL